MTGARTRCILRTCDGAGEGGGTAVFVVFLPCLGRSQLWQARRPFVPEVLYLRCTIHESSRCGADDIAEKTRGSTYAEDDEVSSSPAIGREKDWRQHIEDYDGAAQRLPASEDEAENSVAVSTKLNAVVRLAPLTLMLCRSFG